MSVTATQVLVGIGDFKVDGTSVGSTRGGVVIIKNVDIFEKEVDQAFTPVGQHKLREQYQVRTEIAEATLENLKIAWDIANNIETGASTRTLSLGINEDMVYHELEFHGEAPNGYDRKFVVYRAAIAEIGETRLAKDDITVIPVTFNIYPDTTKPAGKQLGYIVDTTA